MWLNIHGQSLQIDAAVREHVERRLGSALGRFGDQIGRVTVHLIDGTGPWGGTDDRCRIVVEVLGHGRTVVEDSDSGMIAAIDRAADRVGQAVQASSTGCG